MTYTVKEIFYTLQGEGANAGRPAIFCRFAGCNLWSGLERDRATAACKFCDTEFVGGTKYATAEELARRISSESECRLVVLTGGEPLLQVDAALIAALHSYGRLIAIETNGTIEAPEGIDWICVSPKAGTEIKQLSGNELKVVVPQEGLDMEWLGGLEFSHRFAQPMAGKERSQEWAVQWCLDNPAWRLSLQTHKLLGLR
jgi:7-carboxy-7-deazaguanine synthase (Cx14CxxC type)